MKCPYCHHSLRPEDAFCSVCGGPAPPPPPREYDWYVSWEGAHSEALVRGLAELLEQRGIQAFVPDRSLPTPPEEVIEGSKSLALLVSSEAAHSRHVAQEIQWWIRNRGQGSLLAILLPGGPAELPFGLDPSQIHPVSRSAHDKASLADLFAMPFPIMADPPPPEPSAPGTFTATFATPPAIDEWETRRLTQPLPQLENAQFTVTAPSCLPPGSASELTVWCHHEDQREEVVRRAVAMQTDGPAAGEIPLSVSIRIDGLGIEPAEQTVRWAGQFGSSSFIVSVSPHAADGMRKGIASLRISGVEFAKLHFVIRVRNARGHLGAIESELLRHRTALASYAPEDRDEVLTRLQAMAKAVPNLEIFLEGPSLRAESSWMQQIQDRVSASDVFYLFWSRSARASELVEREWRCAYQSKGAAFINPIPLDPAASVPLPYELTAKRSTTGGSFV